jgi:Uma2 family endonuclease
MICSSKETVKEPNMSALANPFFTPEQYLELERQAPFKSEYHSGQIFAMAGASREHNIIAGNIIRRLGNRLDGTPCETYPSDMKVLVPATELYTYPDVTVACGEPQFLGHHGDVLLNPLVIVEVLPDSTAAYDRGPKFALYQRLESLQEYVLVSQDQARVETYLRQPDGQWLYSRVDGLESVVVLESLGCGLPLAEIYDRIAFVETEETGTTHLGEHNL